MTTAQRADRRWAALGSVAALTIPLAGCGGTTPAGSAPASSSALASSMRSPSASAGSETRPEGPWTIVAWTVKRSDGPTEQRTAGTMLASLDPTCPSGPCDLTVTPAGVDGTYREPQAPAGAGATPSSEPITLTWDGNAYVGRTKERVVSCTPAEGDDVPQGYRARTTWSLTFVPPEDGGPARVHGTVVEEAKGTAGSRPKGCTDFTETRAFGGAPTGSIDPKVAPEGKYDASMSSTASTPKSLAPVGQVLWLGPMTAGGPPGAPTITGLTKSRGALTWQADGWGGTTPTAPSDCLGADGAVTAGGADGSESFTALRPVALTKDGTPIFAGTWRLRANPNDKGLAAECSLAVYEGRLLLVPDGAGG